MACGIGGVLKWLGICGPCNSLMLCGRFPVGGVSVCHSDRWNLGEVVLLFHLQRFSDWRGLVQVQAGRVCCSIGEGLLDWLALDQL